MTIPLKSAGEVLAGPKEKTDGPGTSKEDKRSATAAGHKRKSALDEIMEVQ